ncbi:MAG: DMT family transporter [Syntrophomonadaceae bacterium]|jgi:transporter family-2 protein|nr:DMT family transporter [Syntrophomonadaceae bacterium]
MMIKYLSLGLAALAGAAMAVQGTLNAALGKVLGIWESTLIVHLIGTATVLAIILVGGIGFSNLGKLSQAPWYAYLGGVLNVIIIYAVVRVIPEVGVGNATTAIIAAQIITALVIDNFGLLGMKKYVFHYTDILGIVLLAVGTRILLN